MAGAEGSQSSEKNALVQSWLDDATKKALRIENDFLDAVKIAFNKKKAARDRHGHDDDDDDDGKELWYTPTGRTFAHPLGVTPIRARVSDTYRKSKLEIVKDWKHDVLRTSIDGITYTSLISLQGEPVGLVSRGCTSQDVELGRLDDMGSAMVLRRATHVMNVIPPDRQTEEKSQSRSIRFFGTLQLGSEDQKPPEDNNGGLRRGKSPISDINPYRNGLLPSAAFFGMSALTMEPVSVRPQSNWADANNPKKKRNTQSSYEAETSSEEDSDPEYDSPYKRFKYRKSVTSPTTSPWDLHWQNVSQPNLKGIDFFDETESKVAKKHVIPYIDLCYPKNLVAIKQFVNAIENPTVDAGTSIYMALRPFKRSYTEFKARIGTLKHAIENFRPLPVFTVDTPFAPHRDMVFDRDCDQQVAFFSGKELLVDSSISRDIGTGIQMAITLPILAEWPLPDFLRTLLREVAVALPKDSFNPNAMQAAVWVWVALEYIRRERLKNDSRNGGKRRRSSKGSSDHLLSALGIWYREGDGEALQEAPQVTLLEIIVYFEHLIKFPICHKLAGFPHPAFFIRAAVDGDQHKPEFAVKNEMVPSLSTEERRENMYHQLLPIFQKHRTQAVRVCPWDLDETRYPYILKQADTPNVSYLSALTLLGGAYNIGLPAHMYRGNNDTPTAKLYFQRVVAQGRLGAAFSYQNYPTYGVKVTHEDYRIAMRVRSHSPVYCSRLEGVQPLQAVATASDNEKAKQQNGEEKAADEDGKRKADQLQKEAFKKKAAGGGEKPIQSIEGTRVRTRSIHSFNPNDDDLSYSSPVSAFLSTKLFEAKRADMLEYYRDAQAKGKIGSGEIEIGDDLQIIFDGLPYLSERRKLSPAELLKGLQLSPEERLLGEKIATKILAQLSGEEEPTPEEDATEFMIPADVCIELRESLEGHSCLSMRLGLELQDIFKVEPSDAPAVAVPLNIVYDKILSLQAAVRSLCVDVENILAQFYTDENRDKPESMINFGKQLMIDVWGKSLCIESTNPKELITMEPYTNITDEDLRNRLFATARWVDICVIMPTAFESSLRIETLEKLLKQLRVISYPSNWPVLLNPLIDAFNTTRKPEVLLVKLED